MTRPNTDPESGLPFGVILANKMPELTNTIEMNGDDLSRDEAIEEIIDGIVAAVDDHCCAYGEEGLRDKARDFIEENIDIQSDEDHYRYEDTGTGTVYELQWQGGVQYIWVLKSRWKTAVRPCSPCYPGAGDLGTPDEQGLDCLCPPPSAYHEEDFTYEDDLPFVLEPICQDGKPDSTRKARNVREDYMEAHA